MTKTCSQCGAVLSSSVRVCNFCDSSFIADLSDFSEEIPATPTQESFVLNAGPSSLRQGPEQDSAWKGELAQRLHAYRTRRRKIAPNLAQSKLPFGDPVEAAPTKSAVAVVEPQTDLGNDFSFTIAIGRNTAQPEDDRMVIDVSLPPEAEPDVAQPTVEERHTVGSVFHPIACLEDRRLAAIIDAFCLLFAYGGFLALFGSLGGEFTFSKLSAAVYGATFAIVYLQYFALFTIFGGSTPGMMLRGLQVASFSGEPPTPRQMRWRSMGYALSAGALFLGFLWSLWDEDALTWHDRLSRTYLSRVQTFAELDSSGAAQSR